MTFIYTITFIGGQKIKVEEKKNPDTKYFLDETTLTRKNILEKVGDVWINPDNITTFTARIVDK